MTTKQKCQKAWKEANAVSVKRYMLHYIHKNRKHIKQHAQNSYQRNKAFIATFKDKPCLDCKGRYKPWQMDFDHRPGVKKLFSIGKGVVSSKVRLLKEIAKCDLVCANCHRDRTYKRIR